MIEIRFPARIEALLAGEEPPLIVAPPVDPNWRIPDRPPEEWWQELGDAGGLTSLRGRAPSGFFGRTATWS